MSTPDKPRSAARSSAPEEDRVTGPVFDLSRLDHLMGLKTSLVDARLRRAFHQGMRELNLRPVDFTILLLLSANDGVSQKALCRRLDISPPGLAVILDRLQARQLLVRARSPIDRREHRLSLTDEGRVLAEEAYERSHHIEHDILQALTADEQAQLSALLAKLLPG